MSNNTTQACKTKKTPQRELILCLHIINIMSFILTKPCCLNIYTLTGKYEEILYNTYTMTVINITSYNIHTVTGTGNYIINI